MEFLTDNIFACIVTVLIVIAISYFLTRWFHAIDKRVRIAQAQLYLLSKIAQNSNVGDQDVLNALDHANGHDTLKGKI